MARGDGLDDPPADDLVSDLAARPVGDGALGLPRGLAGQGDDLTDLLGGDPGRPPRPRGVGQSLLRAQFVQGERPERHPAGAPEPDGVEGHAAGLSDPGIALALGGGEDNPGAEGDLLRCGMAPQEGLEGVVLLVAEFNGKGLGSTQGRVRKVRQGMRIGLQLQWNYIDESIQPGCTSAARRNWTAGYVWRGLP
jgi:hypothetical protein